MPVIDSLEKYKGNTFMVELSDGETIFLNIEVVLLLIPPQEPY